MTTESTTTFSPAVIKYAKLAFDDEAKHGGDSGIGFDSFLRRLASSEGNLISPLDVDTGLPISDYFVSSSHNTYLTGNQLYSRASTEAYKNVLQRGCRCIEIDVWDGEERESSASEDDSEGGSSKLEKLRGRFKRELGKFHSSESKGDDAMSNPQTSSQQEKDDLAMPEPWKAPSERVEPRVLHGHTATREVSFRKVCETIREFAFCASDMPLIVSLEIHTCPEQQVIMVEIMCANWNEFLVELPPDFRDDTPLPTLESLKRRILIKVKYSQAKPPSQAKPATSLQNPDADRDSSDDESQVKPVKKGKIIDALGKLGVYTRSCHFKNFDQPEAKIPTHVFALSEKKIIELQEKHASRLFDHNKKFLMRCYPKGLRVTSSNLDPAPFWRQGVQMVALNWQNINAAMMLNEAMFSGTAGWVNKPEGYRSSVSESNIVAKRVNLGLSIEVLAGQNIGPAGKKPKLYVRCELHVESTEEKVTGMIPDAREKEGELKRHTTPARAGRDPDFERQVLVFKDVHGIVPSLSFLR